MAIQPGLCGTRSKTPKTGFLTKRLILFFDALFSANLLRRKLRQMIDLTNRPRREKTCFSICPQNRRLDQLRVRAGRSVPSCSLSRDCSKVGRIKSSYLFIDET